MCQTNVRDLESGNKSSDFQPEIQSDISAGKKAIYMDDALSRISKRKKWKNIKKNC